MNIDEIKFLYDESVADMAKDLKDNLDDLLEMRKMFRRLDKKKKRLVKRDWLVEDIKQAKKEYEDFMTKIIDEKIGYDD